MPTPLNLTQHVVSFLSKPLPRRLVKSDLKVKKYPLFLKNSFPIFCPLGTSVSPHHSEARHPNLASRESKCLKAWMKYLVWAEISRLISVLYKKTLMRSSLALSDGSRNSFYLIKKLIGWTGHATMRSSTSLLLCWLVWPLVCFLLLLGKSNLGFDEWLTNIFS